MAISIFLSHMNDSGSESVAEAVREEVSQLVHVLEGVQKDLTKALDPADGAYRPR